ncbi:hypothetical protein AALA90_01655 [Lachnospiraceae bacterium 38-10]
MKFTYFAGNEDPYYGLKVAGYGKGGSFWGGSGNVRSKFNKLLNSDYYKTDFGYDCSEIAQDFYNVAGQKGKIYRIEGRVDMIYKWF